MERRNIVRENVLELFRRVLALDDLHVVCNFLAGISPDLFTVELVLQFYCKDLAEFYTKESELAPIL